VRKRWVAPFAGLLLLMGISGICLWSAFERPRFTHHFDIGGERTLKVWSIRRDVLLDFDSNPLMVYYRIDAGGREVVHPTFLEHDDQGEYEFRMVSADGGRLVCVYEVARAADNSFLVLIYDAATNESWPRAWADEGGLLIQVAAKWRERHRRLKAENPELPTPTLFAE
jgi:hypothetical protein